MKDDFRGPEDHADLQVLNELEINMAAAALAAGGLGDTVLAHAVALPLWGIIEGGFRSEDRYPYTETLECAMSRLMDADPEAALHWIETTDSSDCCLIPHVAGNVLPAIKDSI